MASLINLIRVFLLHFFILYTLFSRECMIHEKMVEGAKVKYARGKMITKNEYLVWNILKGIFDTLNM